VGSRLAAARSPLRRSSAIAPCEARGRRTSVRRSSSHPRPVPGGGTPLERDALSEAGYVFSASDYVTRSLVGDYGVDPAPRGHRRRGQSPRGFGRTDQSATTGKDRSLRRVRVRAQGGRDPSGGLRAGDGRDWGRRAASSRVPAASRGRCRGGQAARTGLVARAFAAHARASIFVMPSLFEPFGQVSSRPWSTGSRASGADKCAMPEIIADGETGFVTAAGDAGALAKRIVYLPPSSGGAPRHGRARSRTRAPCFTWRVVAATDRHPAGRSSSLGLRDLSMSKWLGFRPHDKRGRGTVVDDMLFRFPRPTLEVQKARRLRYLRLARVLCRRGRREARPPSRRGPRSPRSSRVTSAARTWSRRGPRLPSFFSSSTRRKLSCPRSSAG